MAHVRVTRRLTPVSVLPVGPVRIVIFHPRRARPIHVCMGSALIKEVVRTTAHVMGDGPACSVRSRRLNPTRVQLFRVKMVRRVRVTRPLTRAIALPVGPVRIVIFRPPLLRARPIRV